MSNDPRLIFEGKVLCVLWRPHHGGFSVDTKDGMSGYIKTFRYGLFTSVKSAKQKAIKYVIELESDALDRKLLGDER